MKEKNDEFYMQKALQQAIVAKKKDEVPVGAIIVDRQGIIVGRGHNKTEINHCQTSHAEVLAIQQACRKKKDWRLDNCSLYVTLEPCLMCYGLIHLSRLARVCYAAPSLLFGYQRLKSRTIEEIVAVHGNHVSLESSLKQDESVCMLKAFFKNARQKKEHKK